MRSKTCVNHNTIPTTQPSTGLLFALKQKVWFNSSQLLFIYVLLKNQTVPEQSSETTFLLVEGKITKAKGGNRKLQVTFREDGVNHVYEKKFWLGSIKVIERGEKKFFSETVFINNNSQKIILGTAEGDIHKREFPHLLYEERKQGLFALYQEQDIPRVFILNKALLTE